MSESQTSAGNQSKALDSSGDPWDILHTTTSSCAQRGHRAGQEPKFIYRETGCDKQTNKRDFITLAVREKDP